MSFLSSPSKQKATAAELELNARATALKAQAAKYQPLEEARIKDVTTGNPARKALLEGQLTADASQTFGGTKPVAADDQAGGSLFDGTMRRAKGLSRVAQAGDQALDTQSLRDRIALVDFGNGLKGASQSGLGVMAGIESSAADTAMQTKAITDAGWGSLVGSVAGAAANYGAGKWGSKTPLSKQTLVDSPTYKSNALDSISLGSTSPMMRNA